MKPQFGDRKSDDESFRSQLLHVIDSNSDSTTRQLAEIAYQELELSETQQYAYIIIGLEGDLRRLLRAKDENGMPLYGQHSKRVDKQLVLTWRPRLRWSGKDYELNCRLYWKMGRRNQHIGDELARECQQRFGFRPADLEEEA